MKITFSQITISSCKSSISRKSNGNRILGQGRCVTCCNFDINCDPLLQIFACQLSGNALIYCVKNCCCSTATFILIHSTKKVLAETHQTRCFRLSIVLSRFDTERLLLFPQMMKTGKSTLWDIR